MAGMIGRAGQPLCWKQHWSLLGTVRSLRSGTGGSESTPTFADAVWQVRKQLRPGWRSPEHAQLW